MPCSICKGPLDDPRYPETQDCGGDCLRCMADIASDPDCIDSMSQIRREKISRAVNLAIQYGSHDGAHHKDWVIDQMVRILAGPRYEDTIKKAKAGEDGPETYRWNEGIAP